MVITTGNWGDAIWPGIASWYAMEYEKHPTEYTAIFDVRSSRKNFERIVSGSGFGLAPVKPQGESVAYDSDEQGFRKDFIHAVYALGFIVTMEEYKDNLYAEVGNRRASRLAFSMRTTKEIVHANVINRAFNSAYTGGDGSALVVSNHASEAGGPTQSNLLATAADISEASLEELCIQIAKATDNRDKQIALMTDCLLIPPDLEFEATRILRSALQNDTANNATNAIRTLGKFPGGVKVNHYLTDADAYFILTRGVTDGLISYQRDGGPDSLARDNDFDTFNMKSHSYDRYSVGFGDWRCIYGTPGA